jgi:hypothetical protein
VLVENAEAGERLNHLGVEVFSTDEVAATQARLAGEGLATATEDNITCCYATQDKVWVDDPDGSPWEIYTVLADAEVEQDGLDAVDVCGAGACAAEERPADQGDGRSVSACC